MCFWRIESVAWKLGTGVRKSGVSYPVEVDKDWKARFELSERRSWPQWILLLIFLLIPIPFVSLWLQLVIGVAIVAIALATAKKKKPDSK